MAAQTVWASRREKGARFLLAGIIPSWVVFEIVMTKLPHYVLPTYPAIAILIAGVVNRHVLARERWLTRGASLTLPKARPTKKAPMSAPKTIMSSHRIHAGPDRKSVV